MAAELTLGAEEELHLIALDRWELSARAPLVLSRLPSTSYSAELQRTTVETNTAVVRSLDELRGELLRLREELVAVAGREGLGVAAVGTAPCSTFADVELRRPHEGPEQPGDQDGVVDQRAGVADPQLQGRRVR